jgi:putative cell wall-binding protein
MRRLAVLLVLFSLVPIAGADPSGAVDDVARIAGDDRYATAAAISARTFETADVVYVASGESYADALAAGPVAAMHGAPVLLTGRTSLPASTRAELERLSPSKIVVAGGSGAVADSVVSALGAHADDVERVAGPDRYTTAAMLTSSTFAAGGPVFVASGEAFPDALAGGALAGRLEAPLLLTPKASLPTSVAGELDRLEPTEIVVLGGPGSVSDAVVGALGSHTAGGVRRVSGVDRYATSAEVSAEATTATGTVLLATGAGFADALAGGAAAAALDAALLLTPGVCLTAAVAAELERIDPATVIVLGGTGAVKRTVENLAACPSGAPIALDDDGSATLAELDLVWQGIVDARAAWGDSGPITLRFTDTTNEFNAQTPGAAFLHGVDIFTDPFRAFAANGEWGQYNVVVHEYFHTIQIWLARKGTAHVNGSAAPVWLVEGSASYLGSLLQTETYAEGGSFETVMANHERDAAGTDATLCSLSGIGDVYGHPDTAARLSLATLGAAALVDEHGLDATVRAVWSALATSDFDAAFAAAYSEPLDSFCASFDAGR